MKDLFDTDKKIEEAIATFEIGMTTSFWDLMTKILKGNIEVVTRQILAGGDSTKEQMDRLRDKLKVYEEVIDTPRMMIERFSSKDVEEPTSDPFHTVETLKEEEKKNS